LQSVSRRSRTWNAARPARNSMDAMPGPGPATTARGATWSPDALRRLMIMATTLAWDQRLQCLSCRRTMMITHVPSIHNSTASLCLSAPQRVLAAASSFTLVMHLGQTPFLGLPMKIARAMERTAPCQLAHVSALELHLTETLVKHWRQACSSRLQPKCVVFLM